MKHSSKYCSCHVNLISSLLVPGCVTTMEKPPFRQSQSCGDWELKERLGMGGFAHVYLYQHHVSVETCYCTHVALFREESN